MSANLHFKQVKPWHIRYVAENMRSCDVTEVKASHGYTPMESLNKAVSKSDRSRVVIYNGKPVAIFGLCKGTILSGIGVPWFLGTNDILKLGKSLTKYGRMVVDEMLDQCPMLVNYVHTKNILSVKWLTSMGFNLDEPVTLLVSGEKFHRFSKKR